MNIFKMPGNLGSVRGSILTIHHYDWPAYPIGDDYKETLLLISAFPIGTKFCEIDNGDESILFYADINGANHKNLYDEKNIHICAWHKDLLEMKRLNFIDGINDVKENEFQINSWEKKLKEIGTDKIYINRDSNFKEVIPPGNDEESQDDYSRNYAIVVDNGITLTNEGLRFINNEINAHENDFIKNISDVVFSLYNQEYYDTAVREACVTLEDNIKKRLKSSKWGDRLSDDFIEYLRDDTKILESWIRTYSQELRMVFKLIRNVSMHNIRILNKKNATVLLFRVYRTMMIVKDGDITIAST